MMDNNQYTSIIIIDTERNDATSIVYVSNEGKESIEHEVGER